MPTVWFIRHGESVSNANLRTTHPAASELTGKGEQQARQIVGAIRQRPDLIVVSPFVRARQTAVPTITHFAPVPVVEWPVHEFTYLHPRRYDGTTGEERSPFAQAYWQRNDPFEQEAGGGESFVDLLARVKVMVERLHGETADFIVVFSHGLFLRAFLWKQLADVQQATPEAMRRYAHFLRAIHLPNGGILKTMFHQGKIVVQTGFEVAHLQDNS